jgi:SAM-dependent methyltransferase
MSDNLEARTVAGFGDEWSLFDQSRLELDELHRRFREYFRIFPVGGLANAEGFDLGCGSGRWSALLAPRVGHLHCIDPAEKALATARRNLAGQPNVTLHLADCSTMPLADQSQDFGVCLGVLHHLPDPAEGMRTAVAKLKPGAPFLVYLYYDLSDRPTWFRGVWRATDIARRIISRLPFPLRRLVAAPRPRR